jgi:ferritin-like metal-binding protein YciE
LALRPSFNTHWSQPTQASPLFATHQLGKRDCVSLLQQTLDEEKAADKKLTAMAEGQVNRKAA